MPPPTEVFWPLYLMSYCLWMTWNTSSPPSPDTRPNVVYSEQSQRAAHVMVEVADALPRDGIFRGVISLVNTVLSFHDPNRRGAFNKTW